MKNPIKIFPILFYLIPACLLSAVSYYSGNFTFGKNTQTNQSITWYQEYVNNPANNEIQDYRRNKVGLDDNNNLVLRIDRVGNNLYHSSRVNSSPTNGIRIGDGEKLSIEFKAMLPEAKDALGNYVPNVPLWPALWIMGNDQKNGSWIGWPYCSEIDAMEWSPTRGLNQQNVAYHWNTNDNDDSGYNHRYDSYYYDDPNLTNNLHTWRVDIYRYHPDQNQTNKIEIYYDDVFVSGSRFTEDSNKDNSEFWYPVTNQNPETRSTNEKTYFLIMNIAMGGVYTGTSSVPNNFEYAEMVIDDVTYERTSIYNDGSGNNGGGLGGGGLGGGGLGDGDSTITEESYNANLTGVFGGVTYSGSNYNFPSWADSWGGVANNDASIYPLSFPNGGAVKFNGSAPSGNVDVRFKFERLPYDSEGNQEADTVPSFYTNYVTVSGSTINEYSVEIPPQLVDNTYSSFLLYLDTRDRTVMLEDFEVIKTINIPNYILNLNYDNSIINISKDPDLTSFPSGTNIIVQATPVDGYILSDPSWSNKLLTIESNLYYSINADPDLSDNDQDGINNYNEYIAGTNLNDPSSYFTIDSTIISENQINISYLSAIDRNYSIEISNDLSQWYLLETSEGNGGIKTHPFNLNVIDIDGLDNNSTKYFFKVDIEKND